MRTPPSCRSGGPGVVPAVLQNHELGEIISSNIRAKAGSAKVSTDLSRYYDVSELVALSIISYVRCCVVGDTACQHVRLAKVTPKEITEPLDLPILSNVTQNAGV